MDKDGYPDDQELQSIKDWSHTDFRGLMKYVEPLWTYPNRFRQTGSKYYLSTGGWSGNESIIEALQGNLMFWLMCWTQSKRGGHYWFELPPLKR